MPCTPCTSSSPISFGVQYFYNAQCSTCTTSCSTGPALDAKCIYYNGPDLTCSGILSGDTLETALQKIDEQICSLIGDYSTYQFNCLEDWCSCTITTEAQFVDQITAYTCETRSMLDTFLGTTFPTYQASINTRFIALEVPGITCSTASVTPTDTLQQILTKYCTQITNIKAAIDVSFANWAQCFVVGSPPSTITEGFDLILDQLCSIQATADAAAVLPTFNNTAYTCLSTPTANDSLVETITKILDRLCQTPLFDASAITWNCSQADPADLTEALQSIEDQLSTTLEALPTFSGDFVVEATNPLDPCAGVTVSLATPLNQDRFVASNASDTSPGTLIDKLTPGANIALDDTSTPGQVIITSTGDTYKVQADISDTTQDYLEGKVEGDTDGVITISTAYNAGTEKVQFTPSISTDALMELIFSTIEASVEWKARFCTIASTCVPGYTCTTYTISNGGAPEDTGSYSYTDCFGITQSGTLAGGEDIQVCAIGGIIILGTLTVLDEGACPDLVPATTTTTTTTVP